MKVLLIERAMDGHRPTYAKWLSEMNGHEMYLYAPQNIGLDEEHYFLYERTEKKSLREYLAWICKIRQIMRKNKIDVAHFMDGDSIMRYFGIGFGWLDAKRIVITYHHFFSGKTRKKSYLRMCRGRNRVCVVHTKSIQNSLQRLGIGNAVKCGYPAFNFESLAARNPVRSKRKYGIPEDIPVIGIVGCLSKYKNIVPFLEVMQKCKMDFHILICGKENDVTGQDIQKAVDPYKENVTMMLRKLTEEEYEEAITASDIIFCIYGHEFNGASGPLTDGVCAKKLILACEHGSLGETVSKNDLGLAVRCDDAQAILQNTERALRMAKTSHYSADALKYRNALQPKWFCDKYQKIYSGE